MATASSTWTSQRGFDVLSENIEALPLAEPARALNYALATKKEGNLLRPFQFMKRIEMQDGPDQERPAEPRLREPSTYEDEDQLVFDFMSSLLASLDRTPQPEKPQPQLSSL
jgi:hypothetical protein